MSDSSDGETYIDEAKIEGSKPNISEEKKKKLIEKGKDATCKISLPDVVKGIGYFCNIIYQNNNLNILCINNEIINKESLKQLKNLKIKYKEEFILLLIEDKILNKN